MRLVIAGAAAWVRSGYGPLLNAGHKIIAVVNTPPTSRCYYFTALLLNYYKR